MIDFFSNPFSLYTYFALGVLVLALIEIVLFFVGPSISNLLDINLDLDFSQDFDLNIFSLKGVPFLILIMFFTVGFCLSGYYLNNSFNIINSFNFYKELLFVILSCIFGIFTTLIFSKIWLQFIPEIQTFAVSKNDFISKVGKKLNGKLTTNNLIQVKILDKFNKTHYLNCFAASSLDNFSEQEQEVLIVKEKNGFYYVLPFISSTT